MEEIERILERVLARIKPEQRHIKEAERFVKELQRRLKKAGVNATAMIGGSTAKGTFLKGDHDIDLFVRFDPATHAEEELSDLLEQALPEEAERIHGSRDYFQLRRGAHQYEIVPVLAIKRASEARNVTDVSPLHVAYVAKRLRWKRRLADEIRLAKQFCKAAKVYGAESYINGFSGHVIDLLIIRYGSFRKLLKVAAMWGERVVLDPAGHHKRPAIALTEAKRLGPMILIDPVQPERNAAAALSREQYERFKEAARSFLDEPTLSAFTVEHLTPTRIKEEYERHKEAYNRPTRLVILESEPLEGKEDVVATKLLKIHQYLVRHSQRGGFTLLDDGFEYNRQKERALHYLVYQDERLPATFEQRGPPVAARKDAKRFTEKHQRAYERNGRLYVRATRKHRTPLQLLDALLREAYVRERCARIKRLPQTI